MGIQKGTLIERTTHIVKVVIESGLWASKVLVISFNLKHCRPSTLIHRVLYPRSLKRLVRLGFRVCGSRARFQGFRGLGYRV